MDSLADDGKHFINLCLQNSKVSQVPAGLVRRTVQTKIVTFQDAFMTDHFVLLACSQGSCAGRTESCCLKSHT